MFRKSGILIVAFWFFMLALLVQKNSSPPVEASEAVRTGEQWFGIYMDGKKIGHASSEVARTADGYAIKEGISAVIAVLGMPQEMRTVTSSNVGPDLSLRDFNFSLESGIASMSIKGRVEGNVLRLEVNSAGTVRKSGLPLDETPHLATDMELYILSQGLEVGGKFKVPFFDPATLTKQYMDIEVEALEEIKVGERLTPVYRVREEYSGVTATSWIDPETGTIKGEGPMGFTMLRMTKEQAMKADGGAAVDITALTSIKAEGTVPAAPRKVTYMKAAVTGGDLNGLMHSGGRQKFSDGIVEIAALPIWTAAPPTVDVSNFTKPEPFIQADDPEVIKAAREIVAGEADAHKAARKINGWVYETLEKKPSAGLPSAVEVLKNRSGDCNEHTALFTALARAAGVPARMAAGVVLLDGRFYYHAWPEVFLGDWIAVDPTFGQFPADATHIRLAVGGLDEQLKMMRLVGKLKIQILEFK